MSLVVEGVSKRFGYRAALDQVSLSISPGEFVCLLGPNGAGKSTLLRTIASRQSPEAGRILWQGRSTDNYEHRRAMLAQMSALSHQTGLISDLSAAENLTFFLGMRQRRTKEDSTVIGQALGRVGLALRADDLVRTFSRGMRQRLALARVFMSSPQVVLLDEPLTGLDLAGQQLLLELVREAQQSQTTFLAAVHSEEAFSAVARRYVYLNQGRIVADIARDKFTASARAHVRQLLYPPAG